MITHIMLSWLINQPWAFAQEARDAPTRGMITVRPGDTLFEIGERIGFDYVTLAYVNGKYEAADDLDVDEVVVFPLPGEEVPPGARYFYTSKYSPVTRERLRDQYVRYILSVINGERPRPLHADHQPNEAQPNTAAVSLPPLYRDVCSDTIAAWADDSRNTLEYDVAMSRFLIHKAGRETFPAFSVSGELNVGLTVGDETDTLLFPAKILVDISQIPPESRKNPYGKWVIMAEVPTRWSIVYSQHEAKARAVVDGLQFEDVAYCDWEPSAKSE